MKFSLSPKKNNRPLLNNILSLQEHNVSGSNLLQSTEKTLSLKEKLFSMRYNEPIEKKMAVILVYFNNHCFHPSMINFVLWMQILFLIIVIGII